MIDRKIKSLLVCCLMIASAFLVFSTQVMAQNTTSIVALVNDDPISNYDINMRIKLSLATSKEMQQSLQRKLKSKRTQKLWRQLLEEYQPQSQAEAQKLQTKLVKRLRGEIRSSMKGKLKKRILKELVNERIKLQQADKLGVTLTEEELDDRFEKIAQKRKHKKTGKSWTKAQLIKSWKQRGIPVQEIRNRMKAEVSWIRVVRRKFQFQVNIGAQDVDRLLDTQKTGDIKLKTVYKVERIRLTLATSASETNKARRLVRADRLRQSITSCSQLKKAVGRIKGASLKPLGTKSADTFPHTLRSYLSHTKDGHLTPPTLTSSGVELYAVCERKKRRIADQAKRKAVKDKLRQQEFEILQRRHLQDLRQEASIEYK